MLGGAGMKITVVGAGSTYTPELVSGLSRERDRIDVRKLVLHDVNDTSSVPNTCFRISAATPPCTACPES